MEFSGYNQPWLLEDRNLHGGQQLGMNLGFHLDRRRLWPKRRHRNDFGDVVLRKRQSFRKQKRNIDQNEEEERNDAVGGRDRLLIQFSFGQQSELKSAVSSRHAVSFHWDPVGELPGAWSLKNKGDWDSGKRVHGA